MANERIRKAIKESGLKQWQVADTLGVTETTFTRWLRKDLAPEKAIEINTAIVQLIDERKEGRWRY